jgi:hypothetical protein
MKHGRVAVIAALPCPMKSRIVHSGGNHDIIFDEAPDPSNIVIFYGSLI